MNKKRIKILLIIAVIVVCVVALVVGYLFNKPKDKDDEQQQVESPTAEQKPNENKPDKTDSDEPNIDSDEQQNIKETQTEPEFYTAEMLDELRHEIRQAALTYVQGRDGVFTIHKNGVEYALSHLFFGEVVKIIDGVQYVYFNNAEWIKVNQSFGDKPKMSRDDALAAIGEIETKKATLYNSVETYEIPDYVFKFFRTVNEQLSEGVSRSFFTFQFLKSDDLEIILVNQYNQKPVILLSADNGEHYTVTELEGKDFVNIIKRFEHIERGKTFHDVFKAEDDALQTENDLPDVSPWEQSTDPKFTIDE